MVATAGHNATRNCFSVFQTLFTYIIISQHGVYVEENMTESN